MSGLSDTKPCADAGECQSLRCFLSFLQPERLRVYRVRREDFLLSALVEQQERAGDYAAVMLEDPQTGRRTAANLFADRDVLKAYIRHVLDVETFAKTFTGCAEVQDAPVQEIVLQGGSLDADALPVYRHFADDAGRYITSGVVMAKDPETGRYNFSFHRIQLKSGNRLGISLHSRGDLWRYFTMSEAQGKDLEVAVVIGCHPAYYIAGASKIPAEFDDYSWAYAYMDDTPAVTCAKTVDLLVPAYAEYVLEGRIKANEREDEGPFGEYTGYSTSRSTRNVLELSCITRRRDAIYQDLVPGSAWEHLLLSQFTKEIILLDKLRKEIPEVRALCMPKNGCHFHAYLSMKPKAPGQARQAMMLLFGLDLYLKLIIVVDDDVDVYSEQEVLWAVATRMQADRDVFIVPQVLANQLDPSSREGMSAKMGIDATKPQDWDAGRLSLPEEAMAKARALVQTK